MTLATLSPHPAEPAGFDRRAGLRLALPVLALSLLIGVIGSLGYRTLSDEIRRDNDRTLVVIAEQKRQQIEGWLAERRLDAQFYFSGQSSLEQQFVQWLDGGRRDEATLQRLQLQMHELLRVRGWSGLALTDAEGRPVAVVGEADLAPQAALVRDLLRQPRIELVDLHRNAQGVAQFGLLAPIGPPGRPPRGVVYLAWRAQQTLYPLVESWPVPTQTAETYLVRRDGQGVRFLTPLRHRPDAALALTRPLATPDMPAARAAQGERGILTGGRDYRQVPVLAYVAAVRGTPWLMVAEIDEKEAYAAIRTVAWATALAMAIGLLALYGVGFALWRRGRRRRELAQLQTQRVAEARFRIVFEQAPLGVALVDARSGCVLEGNARCAEILGIEPGALAGLDPIAITHPDDVAASRAQIARLDAGEISRYRLNKRYLRPDGAVVWVSLTCARVQAHGDGDADGAGGDAPPPEPPRYLAIFEDISERKRYEHELRQAYDAAEAASAAKSEFLAHMSHEIRTPMNAVLGLAQLLAHEPLATHQREMVERIGSAGHALLAILNDVLDLSKIEAGQLRLEPRPFELKRLLASLDSLMGQSARAKGLLLHVTVDAAPPGLLVGDGLRLEQVLFNLVGNAIKFTEHGEVDVVVQPTEGHGSARWLRFEVRDTGIGIAPDALAGLFAPFTQADAGIGRRFGGTGLGLVICKRLVALMGGEIGVDSQPGQGSTFWFELPFTPAGADDLPAVPAEPPAAAPWRPRLAGAQLLVVDDSAMNRDLVERALNMEGATATLAADGQQAVQILRSRPDAFDAVLMDVQMPVMDGLTAIRLIRGELGLAALPIIAFTAGVRADQQAAARAAGADDLLAKPMDLEQMALMLAARVKPRAAPAGAVPANAAVPPPGSAGAAGRGVGTPAPGPASGSAVAAAAAAFPQIAGIDSAAAARRLGADREVFTGLLQMFVAEYADAEARTRADLAQGARDAAARRMHTLRSGAGFICALELMAAAEALEAAIDKGETALDAPLAGLGRQIAELVAASAPWR